MAGLRQTNKHPLKSFLSTSIIHRYELKITEGANAGGSPSVPSFVDECPIHSSKTYWASKLPWKQMNQRALAKMSQVLNGSKLQEFRPRLI